MAQVAPAIYVEQRRIVGNPDGKGKEKHDSFQYLVSKSQNTLQPKIGQLLSESELDKFIAEHPGVRVSVNG